jgi:hypothetical protein
MRRAVKIGRGHGERHQQGRHHDADAGAAIINADQQAGPVGMQQTQPRRQYATGNEDEGAGNAGQHALQDQQLGIDGQAGQHHEHAGHYRAAHQRCLRAAAPHQGRGHQRADEITKGVRGIHRDK